MTAPTAYLTAAALRPFVGLHVAITRDAAPGGARLGTLHGKLLSVREYEDSFVSTGGEIYTERGPSAVALDCVVEIRALGTSYQANAA